MITMSNSKNGQAELIAKKAAQRPAQLCEFARLAVLFCASALSSLPSLSFAQAGGTVAGSVSWEATPVGTAYGGLGGNNSTASGVPLFASGAVTIIGVTGSGNVVLSSNPSLFQAALNGGTIDNMAIGSTTPDTGVFTSLTALGSLGGPGFTNYFASPPAIGGTTPNSASFTNGSFSGDLTFGGYFWNTTSPQETNSIIYVQDQSLPANLVGPTAYLLNNDAYELPAASIRSVLEVVDALGTAASGNRFAFSSYMDGNIGQATDSEDIAGYFTVQGIAGAGNLYTALNTQVICPAGTLASAQCVGQELDVGTNGPVARRVGLQIIDLQSSTVGSGIDAALLEDVSTPGVGFKDGILFGWGAFPIAAGGSIISTSASANILHAGIDFSNLTGDFPDLILGSANGKIYFGDASADGGEIVTETGINGPAIAFGSNLVVINNFGQTIGIASFGTSGWTDPVATDCTSSISPCAFVGSGGLAVAKSGWFGTGIHAQNLNASGAAATTPTGQISYGGTTVAPGTATCPTTAGVVGCEVHNIAGRTSYVPYYQTYFRRSA
jgi:hypothetical protein